MKRYFSLLAAHLPWLAYALVGDVFFAVLLWFTDVSAFRALVLSIVLFSVLSFLLVCAIILASESRMSRALNEFLANPNEEHCQILLSNLKGTEMRRTKEMCDLLISREERLGKEILRNEDYEEYVEAWAHEAKTPMALLTMILDNNRDSLAPEMVYKIEYIRTRLNECVEQMLQYSRIKGEKKDYLFEQLAIKDVIDDVIDDYRPLLEEKDFLVINHVRDEQLYGDRRALRFILGQIVSNSIKLILCDEPTGALDSKNAKSLMTKLSGLNKEQGATILMVTHDSNAASFCSRIMFIQDGKIFHELRKEDGEDRQAFYDRILKVLAQLGGGSANVL